MCVTGVGALVTLLCGCTRTGFDRVLLLFPTILRAFIALTQQRSVEQEGEKKHKGELQSEEKRGVEGGEGVW